MCCQCGFSGFCGKNAVFITCREDGVTNHTMQITKDLHVRNEMNNDRIVPCGKNPSFFCFCK